MPRCYDCLTENVTVKLTDEHGPDRWFCAEDWDYWQSFAEKVDEMLAAAHVKLTRAV